MYKVFDDFGVCSRELWGACAGHNGGQATNSVGVVGRDVLGDHTAHRDTDNVGAVDVEFVEEVDDIKCHVIEIVRSTGSKAKLSHEEHIAEVGRAKLVEFLGMSYVAIVKPNDVVASICDVLTK